MQTLALLHDTLRQLLARRMFWISLGISALIVVAFGSIGFDSKGVSIFFGAFHFEDPRFTAGSVWSKVLILGIFSTFIVPIWLAWGSSILALISVTTVFPDFMSDGAIDLVLSKPIGRLKIFLVKYLGCMLFVLLQMTIVCVGVFFIIAWRIGQWNWIIFAAIPIVVAYFSYIFGFNVLMAVTTRSPIAALLFTMLFWFCLFIAQKTESSLLGLTNQKTAEIAETDTRIDALRARIDRIDTPSGGIGKTLIAALTGKDALQSRLAAMEQERDTAVKSRDALRAWHQRSLAMMTLLPKNQETIGLLNRWLTEDSKYTMTNIMLGNINPEQPPPPPDASSDDPENSRAGRRRHFGPTPAQIEGSKATERQVNARSVAWVVGTSLGFEAMLIGVAAIIFIRRDF